jgi:hypothetical protein
MKLQPAETEPFPTPCHGCCEAKLITGTESCIPAGSPEIAAILERTKALSALQWQKLENTAKELNRKFRRKGDNAITIEGSLAEASES